MKQLIKIYEPEYLMSNFSEVNLVVLDFLWLIMLLYFKAQYYFNIASGSQNSFTLSCSREN